MVRDTSINNVDATNVTRYGHSKKGQKISKFLLTLC